LVVAAGKCQAAAADRIVAGLAGVGGGGPGCHAGSDGDERIAGGNAAYAAGKAGDLLADRDRLAGGSVVKRGDADIRTRSGGDVLQDVIGGIDTTKRNTADIDCLADIRVLSDEISCLAVGQRVAGYFVGRACNDRCRCCAVVGLVAG
jgi:hypothetical protein